MKLHRVLPEIESPAAAAIVTGDPDRIPVFATALGKPVRSWQRRELVVTEVQGDGPPMLVACHGQGGFGTAILVEELIDSGVRAIVRVGSCGTLQPDVARETVVVSTGCVRDDGTSANYLPIEVPAVPDVRLVHGLCRALEDRQLGYVLGLTHCRDAYYSADSTRRVLGRPWRERYALLADLGVVATEAEVGALFAVSTVRRVRAAALFVVGAASDPGNALVVDCAIVAAAALAEAQAQECPDGGG
jgi:uridine phosphorylase